MVINNARCFTLEARKGRRARQVGSTFRDRTSRQRMASTIQQARSPNQARAYGKNYSTESARRRPAHALTHYAGRASSSVMYTAQGSPTGEHTEQVVQKEVARRFDRQRLIGTGLWIVDKKRDQRGETAQARHRDPGYLSRGVIISRANNGRVRTAPGVRPTPSSARGEITRVDGWSLHDKIASPC